MFNFIPATSYPLIYFNVLLLMVIITYFRLAPKTTLGEVNAFTNNIFGVFFVIMLIFFMGYRPISWVFGDMGSYAHSFNLIRDGFGSVNRINKDLLFDLITLYCSKNMAINDYFFILSILYIVPLVIACRIMFKQKWLIAFLMLITAFSFWTYGTNGLRNGIGTSVFILALALNRKILTIGLMVVAVLFHKSLALPLLAYIITLFFNKTDLYLRFWFLAIPFSFAAGNYFEGLFIASGLMEDRVTYYLAGNLSESDYNMSFRWDFLLYSASGVFAGWYYIYKLKIKDKFYQQIYNIYLITNMFWVLIIRAAFSNRFAYLSWFMLSIVLIYPLLKYYAVKKQPLKVAQILLANIGFSYFMIVILGK